MNNALVDDLPSTVSLARNKVRAPKKAIPTASPYDWSVRKDGARLVLGGYAPSEADRSEIVAMARRRFPDLQVVDQMSIAKGAPRQGVFMDSVDFSLKQLTVFDHGRASLRDRDYSIEGLTLDRDGYARVSAALENDLPKGVTLASKKLSQPELVIPTASPYTWTAKKNGDELTLSGNVHDDSERADILAAARKAMPGVLITDNMTIARGVPTSGQWGEATAYGLRQLAQLESGEASLSDMQYSITGRAGDGESYEGVKKGLERLPSGFDLASEDITAPKVDPYTWRADYFSGRVTLSGYAPDTATRQNIRAQAKKHFPNAQVIDNMEQGFGAPTSWSKATDVSLRELSQLQSGSASIWNREVELRGSARDAQQRKDVQSRMKSGVPDNYLFYDNIRVPKPVVAEAPRPVYEPEPKTQELPDEEVKSTGRLKKDVCQTYLNSILASEVIRFKTASAELSPQSFPVLTRLAFTANRCPDTRIEIAGHTDSDGSKKFNKFLSLRRARSVVKYLTDQGVLADRLSAIGYGEARPIAPNNSKKNKAKNRRIEFVVKEF